jgi:hypothetical protein
MPHTLDIVGVEMVVLDEDGNGCDFCRIIGYRAAKRQIRQWQDVYTFNYAEALSALAAFFLRRHG